MKLEQAPPPDRVITELLPVLKVIYAAVESAILQTIDFFDLMKASVDPSLAPNLVRYYAKQYLDDEQPLIDVVEFERQELGNNGLLVKFGNHQLRILKSDNGRVPVPGASQLKRDFYQQPLPFIAIRSATGELPPLKLIVLWDATPGGYVFHGLDVALPRVGGEDRSSVDCHWQQSINEKLIAAPSTRETSAEPVDQDEDLPIIEKPNRKSGTNDSNGDQ